MHKTKNNKFFRLWRYKIKIQLYNVCILCDVWLKVANYILRSSNVQYPNWGASDVEYLTFDGRPIESKKSDPKKGASDVEYSTFDYTADRIEKIRSEEGCFGCRIFDIRLYGRSNRKNAHNSGNYETRDNAGRTDRGSDLISCEYCRSSRNNRHYAPRHVIYY